MKEEIKQYLDWCKANGLKPGRETSLIQYMKTLRK